MNEEMLPYESRVDPAPRMSWLRRRRSLIVKSLVSIVAVLLLVSVLLPTLQTRDKWGHGHGGRCANNLRQIGLAIQMYVNDNRGRLPPDLATVMVTQDLQGDDFVCRSTADVPATGPTTQALLTDFAKPGHCSYLLASPLPKSWNAVTPAHVLAYEAAGNHHGGGTNVLFGDGRCERLTDGHAAYLISELKAGFNPPR